MKTIKYILSIVLLAGWMFSCDNPEDFQDVLYFTGTDVTPVIKYSLEEPTKIGLSVRASSKVDENIKIGVKVNPDLVEKYNETNGTSYKVLSSDVYTFDSEMAVINKDQYASDPFYLDIKSIDSFKDEDTYCLPVEMTGVQEGGLPILESSRVMYLIINRTIITKAAILNGTYFSVDFRQTPELAAVSQVTMEARVYLDDYQNSNPYISTVMGLEENFLLRLGDVKIPKDYFQLAGGGYPVASTEAIPLNKWVHLAATYDGSRISIYIDGRLNAYTDAPRGAINLHGTSDNRQFYIGTTSNSTGRTLKGKISEARVWTRALTEIEIANNMCAVSADSPDLLAYWKFNTWKDDTNKNIVVDYTGHGYDAVLKSYKGISWIEGVRCP